MTNKLRQRTVLNVRSRAWMRVRLPPLTPFSPLAHPRPQRALWLFCWRMVSGYLVASFPRRLGLTWLERR
jgi:hypothetical protein